MQPSLTLLICRLPGPEVSELLIQGKKELLAKFLFGSRISMEQLPFLATGNRLLVLAYHRICPLPDIDYPFQHEIISATAEEFDRQMTFLKANFNVLNFHQIAAIEEEGQPIPRNSVVITFDDGYEDNFTTAFPILHSHGLTASVYVSTKFIDAHEPFWFEMLSYFVMKMKPGFLEVNRGNFRIELTEKNRSEVRRDLGRAVRVVSDSTRHLILSELEQRCAMQPTQDEIDLVRPMSWDQIRALNDAGIEIGSHTVSHPFLVQLSDQQLEQELQHSKRRIEEETGTKVSSLSYPTGGSEYFDSRSIRIAKENHYNYAVSYDHAAAHLPLTEPFSIPRIHVEPDVNLSLFKANLLLPQVFVR